jgi:hypothetical protein
MHTSKLDLGRERRYRPPAAYHRETFLQTTNPTIGIKGSICRPKKKMDLLLQAVSGRLFPKRAEACIGSLTPYGDTYGMKRHLPPSKISARLISGCIMHD